MQLNLEKIVWFNKPKKREKLTATLGSNQKLFLSDALRNQLPENIQFGFDASSRTLVIAESENPRDKKCKNGMVFGLVDEILSTGMKLPICFEFELDNETNCGWVKLYLERKNKSMIWNKSWHFINQLQTNCLFKSEKLHLKKTDGKLLLLRFAKL